MSVEQQQSEWSDDDDLIGGRVAEYHWSLWAKFRSDPDVGIGYPTRSPFYTPPRRPADDHAEALLDLPTDADFQITQQIQMGIQALAKVDSEGAQNLIEWYGAYVGAPKQRGQRITRMGINPRQARYYVRERMAWVEGWVDCYQRGA